MNRFELIKEDYIPGLDWRDKNIICQVGKIDDICNCNRHLRRYGYVKDNDNGGKTYIIGETCVPKLGLEMEQEKRWIGRIKNSHKKYESNRSSVAEMEQNKIDTENFKAELDATYRAFESQTEHELFEDFILYDCGKAVYKKRQQERFQTLLDSKISTITRSEFDVLSNEELSDRVASAQKIMKQMRHEHINVTHDRIAITEFLKDFGLFEIYHQLVAISFNCNKMLEETITFK
jgi:hypothetical protein